MWPFLNNVITTCGCTHCTPSTSICYTGVNLSCIGVNKNDTLSVALQKINALMCTPITNTEIITALGYTPSNDDDVVHKTGNETIAGVKTFTSTPYFSSGKIHIKNQGDVNYGIIERDVNGWYFQKDHFGNPLFQILTTGSIRLFKNSLYGDISTSLLTSIQSYQLPDSSGTIAIDENLVHRTGNETIDGAKTFNNSQIFIKNAGNTTIGSIYKSENGWRFLNSPTLNSFSVEEGVLFLFKTTISIYSRIDTSFLTAVRTHNLPDASGTIALVETIKPYKVYTALLSQSGTSAPTLVVLENTLGDTVTPLYNSVGNYTLQLSTLNLFTSTKTFILLNSSYSSDAYLGVVRGSDNELLVNSTFNGSNSNNVISDASIEIRVYN